MSFSDAEEEKLINLVAKYPIIYDTSHADYRNVLAKDNVWKIIGKELNKSGKYGDVYFVTIAAILYRMVL